MTTSPPRNISLLQRDSYGFGNQVTQEGADGEAVNNDDQDQEEELGAFIQESSRKEASVFPTNLRNLSQGDEYTNVEARGIIPDSSYGPLLRSVHTAKTAEGDEESVTGEVSSDVAVALPPVDESQTHGATSSSYNAFEAESMSGTVPNPTHSTQYWDARSDSDFGEFAQASRVS